ncbi:hypothetical protein [Paenibacillus albiflavus]|nr:hypothetical protein [Paenibacillus albiflavus]
MKNRKLTPSDLKGQRLNSGYNELDCLDKHSLQKTKVDTEKRKALNKKK